MSAQFGRSKRALRVPEVSGQRSEVGSQRSAILIMLLLMILIGLEEWDDTAVIPPRYFILAKVFWSNSRSLALPVFSRVLSIHFFSKAFLVGRSL